MKTKRIISAIISVVILLSCVAVNAATFPPKDSAIWTNLSDKQADALLNQKNDSYIFFFYRDSCYNSKTSITAIIDYATKNNMALCGLNITAYPSWRTWAKYLQPGKTSISFPFVIVYNAKDNATISSDNVLNVAAFQNLLKNANMLPESGSAPKPNKTVEDTTAANDNSSVFKDVAVDNPYYNAINQLVNIGVLSGYEDGTFKPNNTINRTEAAAVIVRAGGLKIQNSKQSTYTDVANDFWGKDYIMAASDAGIINGMGNGIFAPTDMLTRSQIIKMIVCMLGLEQDATKNGGWPTGYIKVAYNNNIIDSTTYTHAKTATWGNFAATRGEVAQWIYNSRRASAGTDFKVNGKVYKLGMSSDELGVPDEIWPSVNRFEWYVFGTGDYKNFFVAGVIDSKVIALGSSGVGFEYKGYRAGETLADPADNSGEFLLDKNDNNIIHGVFMIDPDYNNPNYFNIASLHGESQLNFHFTNGFRVYHKLNPYKWDMAAAEAARLHSVDMANNNYFNHKGLDGRSMSDRMSAQGIRWTQCAENIAAGRALGILAYDGWVNSAGHRQNILGTNTYLGVGFAYNPNSTYRYYATQNFYAQSSAFDSFIK